MIKDDGSLEQVVVAVQAALDLLTRFHLRLIRPCFVISTQHLALMKETWRMFRMAVGPPLQRVCSEGLVPTCRPGPAQ